jgi:hypothetical protein
MCPGGTSSDLLSKTSKTCALPCPSSPWPACTSELGSVDTESSCRSRTAVFDASFKPSRLLHRCISRGDTNASIRSVPFPILLRPLLVDPFALFGSACMDQLLARRGGTSRAVGTVRDLLPDEPFLPDRLVGAVSWLVA